MSGVDHESYRGGWGWNRVYEAEDVAFAHAEAGGEPKLLECIPALWDRVTRDGPFACGCGECGLWDGLSRRCECGNRRVAWRWVPGVGWGPEEY